MLTVATDVHIIDHERLCLPIQTADGKHFIGDVFGHFHTHTLSMWSVCSFASVMKHLAPGLSHKSEAAGPENHIF